MKEKDSEIAELKEKIERLEKIIKESKGETSANPLHVDFENEGKEEGEGKGFGNLEIV